MEKRSKILQIALEMVCGGSRNRLLSLSISPGPLLTSIPLWPGQARPDLFACVLHERALLNSSLLQNEHRFCTRFCLYTTFAIIVVAAAVLLVADFAFIGAQTHTQKRKCRDSKEVRSTVMQILWGVLHLERRTSEKRPCPCDVQKRNSSIDSLRHEYLMKSVWNEEY